MLPSKMGHACTSNVFGKTKSNDHKSLDDAFESCLNGMIIVPSSKLPKTLGTIAFMVRTMTHACPNHILNARLSTKFNGGTKLLKRVENIEKTFEYNRGRPNS